MPEVPVAPDETDDFVDVELANYVDLVEPRSFFLHAGAGSGKTRSLVAAVRLVLARSRHVLDVQGQSVAVITYTNAAADEVNRRLEFDPNLAVSTIHSFGWELIKIFQTDIREWLRSHIASELDELNSKASRAGTKAESDRLYRIGRNEKRLSQLDEISRFVYSPTGDNRSRDSLSHSEVISMLATFLREKAVLQRILVSRYPFLFIDECQDTNKEVLDALLAVAEANTDKFALGLFGDSMQRIYNDGKIDLETSIPDSWATPEKVMNHRSARRVVELVNRIRADGDGRTQYAREGSEVGVVRLFIADAHSADVSSVETQVMTTMAEISNDPNWDAPAAPAVEEPTVKRLILEHHMAAQRLGFAELFAALYRLENDRTAFLDGSLAGLQLFVRDVIPMKQAVERNDQFEIARLARERSPLLSPDRLEQFASSGTSPVELLAEVAGVVDGLVQLWADEVPTLRIIAEYVRGTGLFTVPDAVAIALRTGGTEESGEEPPNDGAEASIWRECLGVDYSQVLSYSNYVTGRSAFDTHQGVKGLEFPRVAVVVSDGEARGFMFSYEKLFGAKPLTPADQTNIRESKDTSVDRTRRLFYVTCSRAIRSLAIIAYSESPTSVRQFALDRGWFEADEIELI